MPVEISKPLPDLAPVHNARKTKRISDVERAQRNQAKRTYPTNKAIWRKIRANQLHNEPLCRPCKKQGRIIQATQVDHIDGDCNHNEDSNYQSICKTCHDKKSAREHGFKATADETAWNH